jgi:signal-transduction protein with cAMP-binding, CBS, and nucleotidyltransferase domain
MKWVDLNAIDGALKPRIEQYFELKWNYKKGVKEEELIGDLPQSLRKDVLNYIYEDLIANCEVFPRENQGAITTITEKLQRKLIPKEEYVIRQGELAHDMYFILKGEVRVVTATGVTLATLGKHKHFGEMALIQETASVRSTSIIANTHVQAAVLSRKDFKLICENYPEFKTRMQEIIN